MTKRAFWAVSETIASGSEGDVFLAGLAAARLFAWAKLTADGALPAHLSIHNEPGEPRTLNAVFDALESETSGGAFGPLTLDPPKALAVSPSATEAAIRSVSLAVKQGLVDFREVADCLPTVASSRSDLGLTEGLVNAMVSLVDASAQSIYCPFGRSAPLALAAARTHRGKVFAEIKGGLEAVFALHNLLDPEAPITYQLRDALREPGFIAGGQLRRFDAVLAAPPSGMRYDEPITDLFDRFPGRALYGDVLHISHLLAQSAAQVIALVAHGFLFRASAGEAQFKQSLIKDGSVEAVVSLPHLAARSRVPESVLILNRAKRHDNVWFADFGLERATTDFHPELRSHLIGRAESAYSRCVSRSEIEDADFNLLPSRYLALQDSQGIEQKLARYPTVRLGDIATLTRPSHARDADRPATDFQEVQLTDIPQGGHIKDAKPIAIKPGLERRAATQVLEPNDILASIKGTIGRIGIVPDALLPGTQWLASQAFVVIRLNRSTPISPRYLYMFLRSEIGQALLRQRAGGGTVPHVQARDLQALPILVPSLERQRKVEADFDALRDDTDLIERLQTKVTGYTHATRFLSE